MTGFVGALSPDSFNNFGELLRYLRERAELSQRELALQVGYHYSYMSRIEKNERLPDSATLMARFIPALGLEDEPRWTERLLRLAASEEKTLAPRKSGLSSASHPAKTDSALPKFETALSTLPLSLTPILGREKEVETLTKIISRPDVRLVTLVGAPFGIRGSYRGREQIHGWFRCLIAKHTQVQVKVVKVQGHIVTTRTVTRSDWIREVGMTSLVTTETYTVYEGKITCLDVSISSRSRIRLQAALQAQHERGDASIQEP